MSKKRGKGKSRNPRKKGHKAWCAVRGSHRSPCNCGFASSGRAPGRG